MTQPLPVVCLSLLFSLLVGKGERQSREEESVCVDRDWRRKTAGQV